MAAFSDLAKTSWMERGIFRPHHYRSCQRTSPQGNSLEGLFDVSHIILYRLASVSFSPPSPPPPSAPRETRAYAHVSAGGWRVRIFRGLVGHVIEQSKGDLTHLAIFAF